MTKPTAPKPSPLLEQLAAEYELVIHTQPHKFTAQVESKPTPVPRYPQLMPIHSKEIPQANEVYAILANFWHTRYLHAQYKFAVICEVLVSNPNGEDISFRNKYGKLLLSELAQVVPQSTDLFRGSRREFFHWLDLGSIASDEEQNQAQRLITYFSSLELVDDHVWTLVAAVQSCTMSQWEEEVSSFTAAVHAQDNL